jgi:hypothetical protein
MKIKAYALLSALALFATAPVYGQDNGNHYGRGHGKGNPHSDKQGHDNNSSDKQGRGDDDDRDFDQRYGLLKDRVNQVVEALSIGTFTMPDNTPIPLVAQGKLYVVMTNPITTAEMPPAIQTLASTGAAVSLDSRDATAASVARFVASFDAAGEQAQASFQALTQDLSGLAFAPQRVPRVVADFNEFVKTASPGFLANPPAEFTALHAVLGKLVAGMPTR